jgi:hypothetical protein
VQDMRCHIALYGQISRMGVYASHLYLGVAIETSVKMPIVR